MIYSAKTVGQLKQILQDFPDDTPIGRDIFIVQQRRYPFDFQVEVEVVYLGKEDLDLYFETKNGDIQALKFK